MANGPWICRYQTHKNGAMIIADLDLQLIAKVLSEQPTEFEFRNWLNTELKPYGDGLWWNLFGIMKINLPEKSGHGSDNPQ